MFHTLGRAYGFACVNNRYEIYFRKKRIYDADF